MVDNTSSFHANNRKNNFFVLCKGTTDDINDGTGAAQKNLVLTLVKQRQNFSYLYITMAMRVTCKSK